MSSIRTNIVFNLITKFWSLIAIYIFVPFYIQILGEELYGIVSFFSTMQSAVVLLGIGLENTLKREFAVKSGDDEYDKIHRTKLIRSVEFIYAVIGICVAIICFVTSDMIAEKWLNIGDLSSEYVSTVITLMGMSISIQMITSLYSGCLFGLDFQKTANIYNIFWSTAKYCGSLLIIWLIVPDLRWFYAWYVLIDVAYLVVLRMTVGSKIRPKQRLQRKISDFTELRNVWKYATGILTISCVSLVNKQLDKIIISGTLSLTELGAYNLATTLGSLTAIFASAMYTSVFSRFTSNISIGNGQSVIENYQKINKIVNTLTGCMGAYIAVYCIPLIRFWTGSSAYDSILSIAGPLVVMAITMAELQEIPYALVLAHGNTKINTIIGLVYLPFVCIFTWLGIRYNGLIGAGVVYFVIMSSQTLIYQYVVNRKYGGVKSVMMSMKDVVIPVGMAFVMAIVSNRILQALHLDNNTIVIAAVVLGGFTFVLETLLFNREFTKDIKLFLEKLLRCK